MTVYRILNGAGTAVLGGQESKRAASPGDRLRREWPALEQAIRRRIPSHFMGDLLEFLQVALWADRLTAKQINQRLVVLELASGPKSRDQLRRVLKPVMNRVRLHEALRALEKSGRIEAIPIASPLPADDAEKATP